MYEFVFLAEITQFVGRIFVGKEIQLFFTISKKLVNIL